MPTQKDIKRKINAVANIRKVTKAMEAIARIKLQKAMKAAVSAREYCGELSSFMLALIASSRPESLKNIPFFKAKKRPKNITFVVMVSDKGFCGFYNSRMINSVVDAVRQENINGRKISLITVGKKGAEALTRKGYEIIKSYQSAVQADMRATAEDILDISIDRFLKGEADEVYIFYNHFDSVGKQSVSAVRLLPISDKPGDEESEHIPLRKIALFEENVPGNYLSPEYIFEPGKGELLPLLVKQYLETLTYQAMLEATASEHAARMIAMQQSTQNADEMMTGLTMVYNKVRQAAITKELTEVVGSAEALG